MSLGVNSATNTSVNIQFGFRNSVSERIQLSFGSVAKVARAARSPIAAPHLPQIAHAVPLGTVQGTQAMRVLLYDRAFRPLFVSQIQLQGRRDCLLEISREFKLLLCFAV